MGSIEKGSVHYCCVSKGGKIFHSYNDDNSSNTNNVGGDLEIEKLASLCLEKVPQHHKWYTQTMNKRTYSYLMEDGCVYFAIAEVGLGNQSLISFLEHYRDEYKKLTKRGSSLRLSWKGKGKNSMSNSNLNSVNLQEQLVPVIRQLISSLQNVGQSSNDNRNGNVFNPSSSPYGGHHGNSTKAPLLGIKSGKQDKRNKDHIIGMRGFELEEQCKSSDRGLRVDSDSDDPRATGSSPVALQKEMSGSRRRSSSQNVRRKWCRLVRFVLAVDAGVCIILLIIWLVVCKGIQCIR